MLDLKNLELAASIAKDLKLLRAELVDLPFTKSITIKLKDARSGRGQMECNLARLGLSHMRKAYEATIKGLEAELRELGVDPN